MNAEQAREALGEPVTFEVRSLYWACAVCGAMVTGEDRDRHRRAHEALAVAIGGGG